jgi:hypothetical protein
MLIWETSAETRQILSGPSPLWELLVGLSLPVELGKVVGLAGVALWMVAFVMWQIIKRTSSLSRPERGPMFRFIAIGVFALGALCIVVPLLGALQTGTNVKTGDCGIANSGTAVRNSVNCEPPPPATAPKP